MSQPGEATLEALTFIRANPDCRKYDDYASQHEGAVIVDRQAFKRLRYEVKHDRRYKEQAPEPVIPPVAIPDNINLVTGAPLTLDLTSWLYASDFHAPLMHRGFVQHLIDVGRSTGIKDCIIGGDVYDFALLSHYERTQREAATDDVLKVGGKLLLSLAEYFRLFILPGNHDERYLKRLNDYTRFSRMVWGSFEGEQPRNKITITPYDYIYIGPEETGWVVGHPRYFSTIPAKGGAEVAMIQHRSVCGAHNHIIGLTQSRCGRYWSVDPGCMTDPTMTAYHMQSNGLSRYPAWRQGFLMVKNGIPRLMADGLVDWAEFGAA